MAVKRSFDRPPRSNRCCPLLTWLLTTIASMAVLALLLTVVESRIVFFTMTKVVTAVACNRARMLRAVRKKAGPVVQPSYGAFVALVVSSRAFSSYRCTSTRICLPMKKFVR